MNKNMSTARKSLQCLLRWSAEVCVREHVALNCQLHGYEMLQSP